MVIPELLQKCIVHLDSPSPCPTTDVPCIIDVTRAKVVLIQDQTQSGDLFTAVNIGDER